MITLVAAAVTHPGRVRRSNEDSLTVTSRLVAVADGLGGHAAGEVASRIATQRLQQLDESHDLAPDDVAAAIADANRLIVADARDRPERAGMGTTLAGLALVRLDGAEHCLVFNVGDSRVYRWSATEGLTQVSVDHSEVEELRASGQLSAAEAAHHPRRNVVTRCLGTDPPPAPDQWLLAPDVDDRFLVCSDGLSGELADHEIAAVLAEHPDPGPAASVLLEQALAAGGRDNIAVIVVNLTGGANSTAVHAETASRGRTTERS